KLKGIDGCIHETPPLPSQSGHKFKPKSIKCRIVDISSYLKLEQTTNIDPYFAKIEEIVKIEPQNIQKYFYNLKGTEECTGLFKQYESSSSLWTITYCNKILPELISNTAYNFNFREAILLTDILLNIESWIIKSGLLDSFKRSETKTQIKQKSEQYIQKYEVMKSTFDFIEKNRLDLNKLKTYKEKTLSLAYYLRFNNRELIDYNELFSCLKDLINQNKRETIGRFEINYLIDHIELQKNSLKNNELETDFKIGNYSKLPFNSHDDLNLYLKYTLIQGYLTEKTIKKNIYLGEFYKYLSFHYLADYDKKNALKLAYQLIKSQDCCLDFNIEYLSDLNNLEYISNSFSSTLTEIQTVVNKDEWIKVLMLFNDKRTITVHLKQRTVYGYTGYYNNIYCVLPNSNINSTNLKHYNESECDIIINATIQDTYYNFSTIIVRELPLNHKEYKVENVLVKDLMIGDIINSRVKNITNYGVFLSTFAGEGLLHIQNISDLFIDEPLHSIFKIGQEIKVCVLDKEDANKLGFGLKQLKGTPFEDDLNEIEFRIYSPGLPIQSQSSSLSIESITEINKQLYIQGHLFEYFSDLQYDFEGKIKYLKLAKIYYSAIQSSRSYFLNTYIAYFDILNGIEEALENKSIDSLNNTISQAETLHTQLEKNTKSIEKFPSIYRLIFFLDIVRQFNNTTNDSINNLTKYLLNKEYNDFPIFSKVAKVVLSNNLIVSEKNDPDFIFKNLRILYQYLKEGIFDLTENEHEIKERELKERIAQIRNKIFNEESEKVEFKSSLIKPTLDNPRNKRLTELQKRNDQKSKIEIDNLIGKPAKSRVIHSAMKTLAAFANSKGGTLFIGINDDGEFIGLKNDYDEIGQASRDELGKRLDEFIKNYIGNSFFGLVSIVFESIDRKDIIVVEVKSSEDEVFLIKDETGADCSDFYIRRHSSSVKLSGKELIEYYKWRYKKPNT
ncbi:MAG: putative DNA binding domain-containing protein, partial [Bacteroidia bacterium]|nr:putative DNA binding domain-containing protein [Bacteroidia bacterium]